MGTVYLNDSGSLLVPSLIQTNLLQLSCFKYILSCSCSSTLWLILHIFRECNFSCNSDTNLLKSYTVLLQNCATATMQKLWEVQPQGLVLVLHPGQVQAVQLQLFKSCGKYKLDWFQDCWFQNYWFQNYSFFY